MEQLKTHLDMSKRGWLIDQKPQTLSELSRLADQYVAIHQPDHTWRGSQHPKGNQFFQKSGQGNFHRLNVLPQRPQETGNKPSAGTVQQNAPIQAKSSNTGFRKPVTCYYCKKPGHIMANCRQRLAQKPADNTGEQNVKRTVGTVASRREF